MFRTFVAAFALALAVLVAPSSAQQDLKPLQAEIDNMKQQVSRLQADLSAAKESKLTPQPPKNPSRLLSSCTAAGGTFVASGAGGTYACLAANGDLTICNSKSCGRNVRAGKGVTGDVPGSMVRQPN
jgi:hypothetical protein